jgi:hypothetical protein
MENWILAYNVPFYEKVKVFACFDIGNLRWEFLSTLQSGVEWHIEMRNWQMSGVFRAWQPCYQHC